MSNAICDECGLPIEECNERAIARRDAQRSGLWLWCTSEHPPKGETASAVHFGFAADELMAGASARHALQMVKATHPTLRAYVIDKSGVAVDVTDGPTFGPVNDIYK